MHQEDGTWGEIAGRLQAVDCVCASSGNDRNNRFFPFQRQGEVGDLLPWKLWTVGKRLLILKPGRPSFKFWVYHLLAV